MAAPRAPLSSAWRQGTRILSIVAMMMSILVALVCTYIVTMLPCTAPHFDRRTCDLFHVMCALCPSRAAGAAHAAAAASGFLRLAAHHLHARCSWAQRQVR